MTNKRLIESMSTQNDHVAELCQQHHLHLGMLSRYPHDILVDLVGVALSINIAAHT